MTIEDEIEAVRSALHLREHWLSMNEPRSTIWLENKARADALRSALARLEASRWRHRAIAPDTDDPILGYSPVSGNPDEDEQAGHYAITSGSFLRSGGWENCTLWRPIDPPTTSSEGGKG